MESGRRKLCNTLETELSGPYRFFSLHSHSLCGGEHEDKAVTLSCEDTHVICFISPATCELKQNPRPSSLSVALFHMWRSVLTTEINKIFITLIKCMCVCLCMGMGI